MKTKGILAFFMLLTVLFISQEGKSQNKDYEDYVVIFIDDDGVEHESIRAGKTISASGNITVHASFQLPKDHELVPPIGSWPKIIAFQVTVSNGQEDEMVLLTDEKVDIPQNGKFNVSLHLNAAGSNLPKGW